MRKKFSVLKRNRTYMIVLFHVNPANPEILYKLAHDYTILMIYMIPGNRKSFSIRRVILL